MKRLSTALAFLFIAISFLFVGPTAFAKDQCATDRETGTKICIMLQTDDSALVSAIWSGPSANGMADGQGHLEYVYKEKDGTEIKVQADGEMKAARLHGKVSIRWSNGSSYDGDYLAGIRHGRGIFKNAADGTSYDGDWKNDMPNGYGTANWKEGNSYQGDWKNGYLDGTGIFRFANGDVYQGEFKNGIREGNGTFKWKDGNSYQGDWKNNKADGKGVYRFANGGVYQGEFKNGMREGQGVYNDATGKVVHSGLWKEDKPMGMPVPAITTDVANTSGAVKADKVLGIPWGASEEEVKRILKERPDTKYWFTKKEGKSDVQHYVGPFNKERAGIYVYFYQGKMYQVLISHLLSEARVLDKFSEFKTGMAERYGPPSSESGKFLDSVVIWDLGGEYRAGVRIQKNRYNHPDRPFDVQLSYWERGTYFLVHPEEKPGAGNSSGKDF